MPSAERRGKRRYRYYLSMEEILAIRKKVGEIEMSDKCHCEGPINDCRNDWEGPGPPPPCPNAPKSDANETKSDKDDYAPEDGWKND